MPLENTIINKIKHFQPYFLQFHDWTKFWEKVNGGEHKVIEFEVSSELFSLSTIVYQYPWYLRQKFWYIAKGGILKDINSDKINCWDDVSQQELEKLFWNLNKEIYAQAKSQGICYLKADWEESLTQKLKLENNLDLLNLYKNKYSGVKISNKIIQYLQTMTLDMTSIPKGQNFELKQLPEFYEYNKPLWNITNSNVKRYTKKALNLDWQISTEKTDENFEAFWEVYSATKDRQAFVTQTKEYTRQLFDQDFSRIIILRNGAGEPCCVWQGIVFGNTFVYLSGGNNQFSFDNYGQYLMHLVAIWMGYCEGLEVYDLGGYDKTKGFGRFKENYKGQIRTFLGDIDIPVNNLKFGLIDGGIELVKKLRG
jgi:lipid II:glycine glycyltransferase (peptidoglycan interpeptide bridge formation enzyme)